MTWGQIDVNANSGGARLYPPLDVEDPSDMLGDIPPEKAAEVFRLCAGLRTHDLEVLCRLRRI